MQDCIYHFIFSDGSTESFPVTAKGEMPAGGHLPSWTRLDFHQCPNCPLTVEKSPHCPMAAGFVNLVEVSGKLHSHEQVVVRVETAERTITKSTAVQNAVGSLMGLLAANSGCPHTQFLQAMAAFHLPFSSDKETIYRVASMYLLSQYFQRLQGKKPDWDLLELHKNYDELQTVNTAMVERLHAISEKDGAINALVMLDSLAKILQFSIDDALEDLRPVFHSNE